MVGWLAQYQQSPIAREGAVFKPDSMNYFSELPEGEPIKKIAHCDVALGGGDYLSFPIAYYYELPDGSLRGYVPDVVFDNSEKHVTQPQVVGKIIKHSLKNVHFEANQGGEGYKDDVIRLLGEKKYRCNVTSDWAPVTKRKEQRIWDCAQEIRELYYLAPELRDGQYRKFMQNLFSFTMNMKKRANDDAPDSLAGLVDFANYGSGVEVAEIMSSLF
jgi:predicted phage terminase large subunit-like protein